MTIRDFQDLDLSIQAQEIFRNGEHLSERSFKNYLVILYQLYNFYVEIYYSSFQLQQFVSFNHDSGLEPYLDQVDLSWLENNEVQGAESELR